MFFKIIATPLRPSQDTKVILPTAAIASPDLFNALSPAVIYDKQRDRIIQFNEPFKVLWGANRELPRELSTLLQDLDSRDLPHVQVTPIPGSLWNLIIFRPEEITSRHWAARQTQQERNAIFNMLSQILTGLIQEMAGELDKARNFHQRTSASSQRITASLQAIEAIIAQIVSTSRDDNKQLLTPIHELENAVHHAQTGALDLGHFDALRENALTAVSRLILFLNSFNLGEPQYYNLNMIIEALLQKSLLEMAATHNININTTGLAPTKRLFPINMDLKGLQAIMDYLIAHVIISAQAGGEIRIITENIPHYTDQQSLEARRAQGQADGDIRLSIRFNDLYFKPDQGNLALTDLSAPASTATPPMDDQIHVVRQLLYLAWQQYGVQVRWTATEITLTFPGAPERRTGPADQRALKKPAIPTEQRTGIPGRRVSDFALERSSSRTIATGKDFPIPPAGLLQAHLQDTPDYSCYLFPADDQNFLSARAAEQAVLDSHATSHIGYSAFFDYINSNNEHLPPIWFVVTDSDGSILATSRLFFRTAENRFPFETAQVVDQPADFRYSLDAIFASQNIILADIHSFMLNKDNLRTALRHGLPLLFASVAEIAQRIASLELCLFCLSNKNTHKIYRRRAGFEPWEKDGEAVFRHPIFYPDFFDIQTRDALGRPQPALWEILVMPPAQAAKWMEIAATELIIPPLSIQSSASIEGYRSRLEHTYPRASGARGPVEREPLRIVR